VPPVRLNSRPFSKVRRSHQQSARKDRKLRYQNAADIRTDLQRPKRDSDSTRAVIAPTEVGVKPAQKIARPRWGAVAAAIFIVVALVAGGWLFFSRKAHALTDKDTIVLADFTNTTGDAVFDDTMKQALGVSLRQSPFLNILSDERIGATLQLMNRPTRTPLTPDIAREVCQRAGSRAYIAGSIANIGNGYGVGLQAVNCQSGNTLALKQVQAAGKEKVLDALGDAAAKLRTELGESLSSVQRFDTPIEQAPTSSFDHHQRLLAAHYPSSHCNQSQ
jgi:eukaryotic-like serine/threonine-protein kinase